MVGSGWPDIEKSASLATCWQRPMDLRCTDTAAWGLALSTYTDRLASLSNPDLLRLDDFYRNHLPLLLRGRHPSPFLTKSDLSSLMRWKLARGKWRPRLQGFVDSLDEAQVASASRKAFGSLPDLAKAVSELTVLKGVGPATASAVLAAYAPESAPFMSDEAMVAVLGNSKEYTLKQYLVFAERLQAKAKELSVDDHIFTPADIERALWSATVGLKMTDSPPEKKPKPSSKRKRKK